MAVGGSVTLWFTDLQSGNCDAAEKIWKRFRPHLVRLARNKLHGTSRSVSDEEDVVQCAFFDFFRDVEQGRFRDVEDRDDLWRLLVTITARKASNKRRHDRRAKRGSGRILARLGLQRWASRYVDEQIISTGPTPEVAAVIRETCRRLLDQLDDPDLRQIAMWKLDGYTNDEIALWKDCVPRTVRRKVNLIRSKWSEAVIP